MFRVDFAQDRRNKVGEIETKQKYIYKYVEKPIVPVMFRKFVPNIWYDAPSHLSSRQ